MSHTICGHCGFQHSDADPEGRFGGCQLSRVETGSGPRSSPGVMVEGGGEVTDPEPITEAIGSILQDVAHDTDVLDATDVDYPGVSVQASSTLPITNSHIKLIHLIDHGGMGEVYRGRDTQLNRDLAIKILLPRYRNSPDLIRRFIDEGRIAAHLQHPGNVPVYDMGYLADGRPYFTMKLVEGHKLSELMQRRKSPSENRVRLLAIFEDMAQTVAYAHDRGVIHRDLKPSNVLIGGFGEVWVIDWGLAKHLVRNGDPNGDTLPGTAIEIISREADPGLANTHAALGTAQYMSPEQARHTPGEVDQRTDVFALGLILCEMLTGRPAYDGESALRMARDGDLAQAHVRLATCGADPELISLATHCLRVHPNERPNDAGVIGAAIKAHLERTRDRFGQPAIDP